MAKRMLKGKPPKLQNLRLASKCFSCIFQGALYMKLILVRYELYTFFVHFAPMLDLEALWILD